MYPNYEEIAAKLEIGKTYTMVKYGEFGFPYKVQFKLIGKEVKPYAQYQESLVLMFIEKGKRKQKGIRVHGNNRFAIWEGFVSPNVEMFNAPEAGSIPAITVRKSFGSSFDSSYMERALNSVEQKPLVMVYEKDEV